MPSTHCILFKDPLKPRLDFKEPFKTLPKPQVGGRGEDETQRNYALGKQRWQRYLASKHLVEQYAAEATPRLIR